MGNIKEKDIIKVKVTGVQPYGAFVSCNDYNGLIHISEVSYGYVKDINGFMNVGDDILSGKNISKVDKNYNCTRNEVIDHIMELLPNVDYNMYLQVLIKLRLFNLEKQYYNDAKTYTYEQEPITNFRR